MDAWAPRENFRQIRIEDAPQERLVGQGRPDTRELSQLERDIDVRRGEYQDRPIAPQSEARLEDQVVLSIALGEHDADQVGVADLLLHPLENTLAGCQVIAAYRDDVPLFHGLDEWGRIESKRGGDEAGFLARSGHDTAS